MNNLGLLIKVWGKVVQVDTSATPTWFVIEDGTYTTTVMLAANMSLPVALNFYVTVTGVSSCEENSGVLSRVIWIRDGSDIVIMNS